MRIQRDDSLAVIVDVQEKLFPLMHNKGELATNLQILIKGLEHLEIPMMVTQQYTKGLGDTVPSVKQMFSDFDYLEKQSFSCCDDPQFMRQLNEYRKKYVILAGIEAHVCILQTAVDLLASQYTPVIVSDCVSSRKEQDKTVAISRLISEGAIMTTYESILLELCRMSGTDEFKTLSQYIK